MLNPTHSLAHATSVVRVHVLLTGWYDLWVCQFTKYYAESFRSISNKLTLSSPVVSNCYTSKVFRAILDRS